ncbi:MAG: FAD-dependent oxidoreductase [Pseudomonadota bacterium]
MSGKIAIIGSGPSGCYLAQALVKLCPDAEITIIDKLCTPYGLIRYGVAADHQGTKAVTRQFARLFEKQGVSFIGNLEIGTDMTLTELRECMDVVVLATGLYADRHFDVTGAELQGIYGAGEITRFWNAHPDSENFKPEFGETVTVLGNGNVALDIIRLLAKSEADFDGSDFNTAHINNGIQTIHVVGRSPLEQAKFDAVMVRELRGISGLECKLADDDTLTVEDGNQVSEALNELFSTELGNPAKQVIFHSGWQVEEFTGDNGRLSSVVLRSAKSQARKTIPCDCVITAIGFEDKSMFTRDTLLQNAQNSESGMVESGLFVAGWFKRGPTGTIPENRTDSQQVAEGISEWMKSNTGKKPGRSAITSRFASKVTSYEDWLTINDIELRFAAENRCRQKIATRSAMMAAIEQQKEPA